MKHYTVTRKQIDGLKLLILQPVSNRKPPTQTPAILWIHGGGYAVGVPAQVDIYPTGFHAFDMLLPFRSISRQAIAAFEAHFSYAAAHYFAPQQGTKEHHSQNKSETE